jgi:nitrogenase subunit NifH
MYFKQFNRKLSEQITGVAVARQLRSNGHLIEMTVDQVVTIDGEETDFYTIAEARDYLQSQQVAKMIEKEITEESYSQISDSKIAGIIKEHHNVRVTDSLIESYVELASSKLFTIDPVATDIRQLNKFDKLVEGKIDYKLQDNSVVAINIQTQNKLNNLLEGNNDIVEYMRENKENFISVIQQIRK